MENYYNDSRVVQALEKSPEELMDVLTFIKEVNFEIKDNLGFDVLSLSGLSDLKGLPFKPFGLERDMG